MTNFIIVLLFVLFPPPLVLAEHPDAKPLTQTFIAKDLEDCKAKGMALLEMGAHDEPDATAQIACLRLATPETAPVEAPAPKNGI